MEISMKSIFELLSEWEQDEFLKDVLHRISTRRHAMLMIEAVDMEALVDEIENIKMEEAEI